MSAWDEVWEIVRQIPFGSVMSYGQVAALHSRPLTPLAVGRALHVCPDDVPWHRVVNARGGCSTDRVPGAPKGRQRRRLEAEGVVFADDGTVDMERWRWDPAED